MLIQDSNNHSGQHLIHTIDGKSFEVSSTHHQQALVEGVMDPEDYNIIGWTTHRSEYHKNGFDEDMALPANYKEVEIIAFPKTLCLGVQGHPEWMGKESEFVKYISPLFMDLIKREGIFVTNKIVEYHGVG